MIDRDTDDRINTLIHDADSAKWAALFAARVRDTESASRLNVKRAALLAEALALDPERRSQWWAEWGVR
jgi:hypothetical protein